MRSVKNKQRPELNPRIITAVLFLLLSLSSLAQKREDIMLVKNIFAADVHKQKWTDQLKNNHNEVTFLFSVTFVIYKELFSSQDVDACVFTPSCSVYAIESIKEEGAVRGFFLAVDRITRCNPGRNKHLPVDKVTGKYFDPVER